MASFKFFNSNEYHNFYQWCKKYNKNPDQMLKRYMRLTEIHDIDLNELISNQIKIIKEIKYGIH